MANKSAARKPTATASQSGFWTFVFAREQRGELISTLVIMLGVYFLFRFFYPDPMTLPDSFGYVFSSVELVPNLFRPIGYAWFLKFMRGASSNLEFTMFSVALLTAIFTVLFMMTVKYLYKPKNDKWLIGLALVMTLSPSIYMMERWLLSDALFYALLLAWIVVMIWHVSKQEAILYPVAAGLIIILLTYTRHAGLFFAIAGSLASIWVARRRSVALVICHAAAVLLVVLLTQSGHRKAFGVSAYSGFSGFNLANSASSILPYIDRNALAFKDADAEIASRALSKLDNKEFSEFNIMNGVLLWRPAQGFNVVTDTFKALYPSMSQPQVYFKAGAALSKYGRQLITSYPGRYFSHFIIPNLVQTLHQDTMHRIVNPELVTDRKIQIVNTIYGRTDTAYRYRADIYAGIAPVVSWSVPFWWLALVASIIYWLRSRKRLKSVKLSPAGTMIILVVKMYIAASIVVSFVEYRYLYFVPIMLAMGCYFMLREVDIAEDNASGQLNDGSSVSNLK